MAKYDSLLGWLYFTSLSASVRRPYGHRYFAKEAGVGVFLRGVFKSSPKGVPLDNRPFAMKN